MATADELRHTAQVDEAFRLETEGNGIIAEHHRHGMPRELFYVWFAAVLTFTGVVTGQLFTGVFGLNVWESLLIVLLCSISFAALGLYVATGPRAGTVTLTISRAAFGVHGGKIPAFFSWFTAVGWESVTMVLTVWAMLSLAQYVGLPSTGVGPTLVALVITLFLTYLVPILGHATLVVMQRVLAIILAACTVLVLFAVLPDVKWNFNPPASALAAHGVFPTFLLALSVGLANAFYGWANFAADYSRYLPKETKTSRMVWATFLGGGLANFIMMGFGVVLGTMINAKAFSENPVMAIAKAIPEWAAIPFLIVVVLGDICANYLNAYSSGMSFLSMGIRLKRHFAVALDGAICTAIGIYALFFSNNFVDFFENFLGLMITVMGPWAAIYIVHHFVVRGRYAADDLVDTSPSSVYWYNGGFNWRAIIAFVIGAVATFLSVNSALWQSPLTNAWFGGADVSAYAAPIVTGIVYLLISPRRERANTRKVEAKAS